MTLRLGKQGTLARAQSVLMGVLNVTPDSFSDGGQWLDTDAAIAHGLDLARQGARLIDLGGESTRPGAVRVDAGEQKRRILPVLRGLRAQLDTHHFGSVALSVDTTRAEVAEAGLDAGASMINDVSAGRDDPSLLDLAARRDAPIILMHMLGQPADMQKDPRYEAVVAEVLQFLEDRAAAAIGAGVDPKQIVIDPGIGFGKKLEHNLQLLANLDQFVATGYAVAIGCSRKRFLADLLERQGRPAPAATERCGGTCATTVLAVEAGVTILRVHDVAENLHALETAAAILSRRAVKPESL
jgi:dihydropteroate synthase